MKNLLCYSLLTFLIFAPTTLTGYGQDDNGADKIALLTAHVWNLDTTYCTPPHEDMELLLGLMEAGKEAINVSFAADGTHIMNMLTSSEGTWVLSSDGTKLTLNDNAEEVANIITLTSDVLEWVLSLGNEEEGKLDVTYRWVKDD